MNAKPSELFIAAVTGVIAITCTYIAAGLMKLG
jgi:hypothetical protein